MRKMALVICIGLKKASQSIGDLSLKQYIEQYALTRKQVTNYVINKEGEKMVMNCGLYTMLCRAYSQKWSIK